MHYKETELLPLCNISKLIFALSQFVAGYKANAPFRARQLPLLSKTQQGLK